MVMRLAAAARRGRAGMASSIFTRSGAGRTADTPAHAKAVPVDAVASKTPRRLHAAPTHLAHVPLDMRRRHVDQATPLKADLKEADRQKRCRRVAQGEGTETPFPDADALKKKWEVDGRRFYERPQAQEDHRGARARGRADAVHI